MSSPLATQGTMLSSQRDIDALRTRIEADERQLAVLIDRISRQKAELEAAMTRLEGGEDEESSTPTAVPSSAGGDEQQRQREKKRRHDDSDSVDGSVGSSAEDAAEDDLNVIAAQQPSPVVTDGDGLLLLGSVIFPYLDAKDLCRSAALVSRQWRRSAETESLWEAIVRRRWPDCVSSLVEAGALGPREETNDSSRPTPASATETAVVKFRSFYQSRMRPQIVRAPGITDEDEFFILIDIPNLVEANGDGTHCSSLKPFHRAFPMASAFRQKKHQNIYEETVCSCTDEWYRDSQEHCHPSAWLHFPVDKEQSFIPNPQTSSGRSEPEEVFKMYVSLLRKSDGKIMKMIQPSGDDSDNPEVEAPNGYGAPWVMYKKDFGTSNPTHDFRAKGQLRATAGLEAENLTSSDDDPRKILFKVSFIVFGLQLYQRPNDAHPMVPMKSVEKLNLFLNMTGLEWA